MRVLLVNPDSNVESVLGNAMPLGLLYIAAILEPDHEVRLIDLTACGDSILFDAVREFKPQVLGISLLHTVSYTKSLKLLRELRELDDTMVIVAGGSYIFFRDRDFESLLKGRVMDYIVSGEGDFVFKSLVDSIDSGKPVSLVKGVYYLEDGAVRYSGRQDTVDLDDLPRPDFRLIDVNDYDFVWCEKPFLLVDWSRGCPHKCLFCSSKDFFTPYRTRSPERMAEDIEYYARSMGVKNLMFADDNFFGDVSKTRRLLQLISERKLDINASIQARVDTFISHPDLIPLAREAGVKAILFGIEDVNEEIMGYYGKRYDALRVKEVFSILIENGVFVIASMIVGSPLESMDSIVEKTDFMDEVNPSMVVYQKFTPHGRLMDEFLEEGKVGITDLDYWDHMSYVCKVGFDTEKAEEVLRMSNKRIFRKNLATSYENPVGRKMINRAIIGGKAHLLFGRTRMFHALMKPLLRVLRIILLFKPSKGVDNSV
ncbi:MAG: radical SAM protein [Candidatus Altiarchaeota archaeon]